MTFDWLNKAPLWMVGAILLAVLLAAARFGHRLRTRGRNPAQETQSEGYSVTAILGLLALLTGFTFSLAIERFEARRQLVLEHANAIGTTYLRVQLLPEPHRTRLSGLILDYTGNAIGLAQAPSPARLTKDDEILTSLWAASAAAYDSIKALPYANAFVASMNSLIDYDSARRASRSAHIPTIVFAVLLVYLVGTACILGYVMKSRRGQISAAFLLFLLTLSQLLILDVDRPLMGGVLESQKPMEALLQSLQHHPPAVFDRWRDPQRSP